MVCIHIIVHRPRYFLNSTNIGKLSDIVTLDSLYSNINLMLRHPKFLEDLHSTLLSHCYKSNNFDSDFFRVLRHNICASELLLSPFNT